MKKRLGKALKILIPIGIGVFFIIYAYCQFSEEQRIEIFDQFTHVNYIYIALSLLLGLLSHISRAYRWNFLLETLGYRIRLSNSIMAIFITYLMNLFIPRSGEVSRALVIQRYENVPFDKVMGTIITERLVDLLLLLGFVVAALTVQFDIVNKYILQKINFQKILIILAISIAIIIGIFIFLLKSKSQLSQRINAFLSGLKEGILTIIKLKKRNAFLFHTLFIWGMYLAMFHVATLSLNATSAIDLEAVLTTFIVGSIAVAFTNGGFGSYPYLVAGILVLYQIPETSGTAFGWVIWTSQFLMFVIFGSLSFLLLPVINKRNAGISAISSQMTP